MNIEDFLALPLAPSIRLRIGPRIEDAVNIDQGVYDLRKEQLIEFCRTLPNLDGAGWQVVRQHTGNNGTLAKVLIALGDLAGIWKMHPSPDIPELWVGMSMHPSIRIGSIALPPSPVAVPKPSRGDLEKDLTRCSCCGQMMGSSRSRYLDIVESEIPGTCQDCAQSCESPDACTFRPKEDKKQKTAEAREEPAEDVDTSMQNFDFSEYLKNFDGE